MIGGPGCIGLRGIGEVGRCGLIRFGGVMCLVLVGDGVWNAEMGLGLIGDVGCADLH